MESFRKSKLRLKKEARIEAKAKEEREFNAKFEGISDDDIERYLEDRAVIVWQW
jgi:hypothetical protein